MNPQQANKLEQEYMEVRTKPQYKVYFVNKNVTKWHVSMLGPKDSRWEDGTDYAQLKLRYK